MARRCSTLVQRNVGTTLRLAAFTTTFLLSHGALAIELAAGDSQDTLKVEALATGMEQATDIAPLPDGRAVVTQRNGDVIVIKEDGGKVAAGHINATTAQPEMGLLGIVADPNFSTNHYLYVYATVSSGDDADRNKVLRVELGDDNKLTDERKAIVDKGLIGRNNHNGGGLYIHKNHLYVSVGDSGWNPVDDPYIPRNRLPTCLNSANGKILRVNLDGSVPNDNPLKGKAEVTTCNGWDQPLELGAPDERIFAWGLRNPFRFWVDPTNGLLWIGDVGETRLEEISVGKGGQHFGYPFVEGTQAYTTGQQPFQPGNSCQGITPSSQCTGPQYAYSHDGGNNAVIGGVILDGCGWPAPWPSRYVFADNGSGSVWTLDVNANRDGAVSNSRKDFARRSGGPSAIRMSSDGALYIVEVAAGAVQKITPKNPTTTTCPPPSNGSGGAGGSGNVGSGGSGTGGSGASNNGSGGTTSASGGTNPGSGGTSSKGGATASGGKSSAAGSRNNDNDSAADRSDDGGCSCRLSPRHQIGFWGVVSGLALVAGALRRTQRRSNKRQ